MEASLIDLAGLIDLILLFTLAEALGLVWWHRKTGQGLGTGALSRLLLPGVFLIVGWRASLSDLNGFVVPLCLAAALAAHVWDIRDRWGR